MANYPYQNYQFPQFGNPYKQQIAQNYMQPQQPIYTAQPQPQTVSGIAGRIVNAENEVLPGEVPSDNTMGYYPSADGSIIWAKSWNNQGGINTREYVLKETTTETAQDPLQPVIERLTAIESALNELKPKTRTRKAENE